MEPEPIAVHLLADIEAFERRAAGRLAADPVGTNVIGAMLGTARSGAPLPDACWIVLTGAAGDVLGVAMQTPPFPLHLPPMPVDAARVLAGAMQDAGREVPGASGATGPTEAFALAWSELTGARVRRARAEGVYVLDRLVPPSGVPGTARVADRGDLDVVLAWAAAFDAEAHTPDMRRTPNPELTGLRIELGRFVLWEVDGRPVSLAGWHPPAAGYGRIGPVYTPPEHRRHGYAAAVTAAATRAVLDSGGEHAMLFTDLANPTSNGVYARLGYRRVGEASDWVFTATAPR